MRLLHKYVDIQKDFLLIYQKNLKKIKLKLAVVI